MEEIKLDVQVRTQAGSKHVKEVRRGGFIPAVVYGGQKKSPTAIQVDRRIYEKIMRQHAGSSVLFHLNVMEGDKKLRDYSALVKEEQHEPVSDRLLHIDFLRISLKEKIEVEIPIAVVGESVGVKKDGGSLDQPLRELDVVCLPTNIPEKIKIDVSALEIGDAIHVKDIILPEGVVTKHDPEAMVLSIVPPMKEEIEPAEGEEAEEPEVIKDKKDAEGEEGEEGKEVKEAEAKAKEKKEE